MESRPIVHKIKDGSIRETEVNYNTFLYSKNTQTSAISSSICTGNRGASFPDYYKKLSIAVSKIWLLRLRLVNQLRRNFDFLNAQVTTT